MEYEIIASDECPAIFPITKEMSYLSRLLERLKSDSFLPKGIRDTVIVLLKNRFEVMISTFCEEIEAYTVAFAKDKH